jgi:hypothetical protein
MPPPYLYIGGIPIMGVSYTKDILYNRGTFHIPPSLLKIFVLFYYFGIVYLAWTYFGVLFYLGNNFLFRGRRRF